MILRLRMFAGPNGSGKSTIKDQVTDMNPNWIGVYVNSDEIQKQITVDHRIDFTRFTITTNKRELFAFLEKANIERRGVLGDLSKLKFNRNRLFFDNFEINSYFASALSDFLHAKLIDLQISFSMETVMSYDGKIELLKRAKAAGFQNYLYYVSTEDPEINKDRVRVRVEEGGHNVGDDKIVSRYYKSLDNLSSAILTSYRAYIFDNTYDAATLFAEFTKYGKEMSSSVGLKKLPKWFRTYVVDKFKVERTNS
jgi:predicted ABC-type ATPase